MAVDIDFVKITPKANEEVIKLVNAENNPCLLYTSPSPRD